MTVSWLQLMFQAPLCAIRPGAGDATLHAVTMESIGDAIDDTGADRRLIGACGAEGLRLIGERLGQEAPLPWPPPARGTGLVRCRECWVATGKRRPRCRVVAK